MVLPDGVVVRTRWWPHGQVRCNATHDRPLWLWGWNPWSRWTDRASRAKRPERGVVEVIHGIHQWAHLYWVDFLVVGFVALAQAALVVAVDVKRTKAFNVVWRKKDHLLSDFSLKPACLGSCSKYVHPTFKVTGGPSECCVDPEKGESTEPWLYRTTVVVFCLCGH